MEKSKPLSSQTLIITGIISIFAVIFLWGFLTKGVYALGFNMTLFSLLVFWLFLEGEKNIKKFFKSHISWILPLGAIIVSFSLFENPFLKIINTFLLPFLLFFFFSYTRSVIEGKNTWNILLIAKILGREVSLSNAHKTLVESVQYEDHKKELFQKLFTGWAILIGLNLVLIPLLASADKKFWQIVGNIFDIFSMETMLKIFIAFALLIVFIALKISWSNRLTISNVFEHKKLDSLTAGIVIGGTLITYFVFIATQLDAIMTQTLPLNVEAVSSLVKWGFWQLFFVSLINIGFFFVYFRKTNSTVQSLLLVFLLASIIILISASQRMYLYVDTYGLSYEKFFASYSVLYFWILLWLMTYLVLRKKENDILKTSLFLALWMYAALCIFPVEKTIFQINTKISQRQVTKMQVYQSHILSIDILDAVEKLKWTPLYESQSWELWKEKRLAETQKKKWYEKNINNF